MLAYFGRRKKPKKEIQIKNKPYSGHRRKLAKTNSNQPNHSEKHNFSQKSKWSPCHETNSPTEIP